MMGIDHGGWIPKGMPTTSYSKRTEKNILDSDGILILSHGKLTGGSALTRKLAKKHSRPWVHVDLDKVSLPDAVGIVKTWIVQYNIKILNVAGPRASKPPSIYDETVKILERVIK